MDYMVRGSNPFVGEIFCTRPNRLWGPPSLLYDGYWIFFFFGGKRPERGVNHQFHSSAEDEEILELYLYSLSGPSWPVVGCTLPSP